jgi:hypothetical protein
VGGGRHKERVNMVDVFCIHRRMKPIEVILRKEGGRIRENVRRGKSKIL